MATYSKRTGTTGTMYILDNGSTVEFIVDAGQTLTYNARMPWRYTINGSTSAWQYYNLTQGGGQRSLGKWTVSTNQTVKFELGETSTQGLGGPTTLEAAINRVGPPPQPEVWEINSLSITSMGGYAHDIKDGGSPLTKFEIGWSTSNVATPQHIKTLGTNGSGNLTDLSPATGYYVKIRAYNAKGVSPWSSPAYAKTYDYAHVNRPSLSDVQQTSVHVSFAASTDGGTPILEYQTGYGTSFGSGPSKTVTGNSVTLTGLVPGSTYYVWGRARTKFGWGPWSDSASNRTTSGSWFYYQGAYRRAVPYVRVNGVWKPATPLVNIAGLWQPAG